MSRQGFQSEFLPRGSGRRFGGRLRGLAGEIIGDIIGVGGGGPDPFGFPPPFDPRTVIPGGFRGGGSLPTPTNGVPTFPVGACLPGEQAAFIQDKPCCPSGMHFSKSTGCCVKNRRMNVMNMKAHARATRRILGNARAQKRARKAVGMAAREMGACPRPSRRAAKPCK